MRQQHLENLNHSEQNDNRCYPPQSSSNHNSNYRGGNQGRGGNSGYQNNYSGNRRGQGGSHYQVTQTGQGQQAPPADTLQGAALPASAAVMPTRPRATLHLMPDAPSEVLQNPNARVMNMPSAESVRTRPTLHLMPDRSRETDQSSTTSLVVSLNMMSFEPCPSHKVRCESKSRRQQLSHASEAESSETDNDSSKVTSTSTPDSDSEARPGGRSGPQMMAHMQAGKSEPQENAKQYKVNKHKRKAKRALKRVTRKHKHKDSLDSDSDAFGFPVMMARKAALPEATAQSRERIHVA